MVGKYIQLHDAYLSVVEALKHGGIAARANVKIRWVDSEEITPENVAEKLKGVEGPEGYLLPEGRSWCVIADQFAEGKGYLPMITEDLSSGDFTILEKEKYDLGRTKKRHGGVLELSDAEYQRLIKAEMEG